jgi:hypothetical protein
MSLFFFFFWIEIFHKFENKNILSLFFLGEKEVIRFLQKIDNHVATFPYRFRFGNNFV